MDLEQPIQKILVFSWLFLALVDVVYGVLKIVLPSVIEGDCSFGIATVRIPPDF